MLALIKIDAAFALNQPACVLQVVCIFYLQRLFIQSFDFLYHPLYFLWRDGWDDRVSTSRRDCCLPRWNSLPSLNGTLPQSGQAVFKKMKTHQTWGYNVKYMPVNTVCVNSVFNSCSGNKNSPQLLWQNRKWYFFSTRNHFLMNIKQDQLVFCRSPVSVYFSYFPKM